MRHVTRYEKNLVELESQYPGIAKLLEKAQEKKEKDIEVTEEKSVDGEIILKVKKNGKERYLAGKRNTKEPAEIWVHTLGELVERAPIFIVGTGNWTYLRELAEHTKKALAIFVYEPSISIFKEFLKHAELTKWMKKHTIVFWVEGIEGMDEEHLHHILGGILRYENKNFSRWLTLPNYDKLFPEQTLRFLESCKRVLIEGIILYNTQNKFSTVMAKNLLDNARYLCHAYKTTQLVEVVCEDIPGIVVAAGPSLNKNIEELKNAKGKAFIIAVDTAIKPLLKAGIVPDMFFVIDAMKPLELVKMEGARNIPMITTLNAASDLLNYHTGAKFFFNEMYLFAEKIFDRSGKPYGDVASGGSVATNAFSLLYKLGITTIILVGQDLAYTNHRSHADGTFQEKMKMEDTSNFEMVEGNYEEKVPTRPDFKFFLEWYVDYIKGCKERTKNFRVINATEGGAKIAGTEIMTLHEAIEETCVKEIDIENGLKQLPLMLDEEGCEWAVGYLKSIPQMYHQIGMDAEKLKQMYQKLDTICKKRQIDTKVYLNTLKKIKKQTVKIEREPMYQLIQFSMNQAQYIMAQEGYMHEDTAAAEGKEIARKGILYTQSVKECAQLLEEYAKEVYDGWMP